MLNKDKISKEQLIEIGDYENDINQYIQSHSFSKIVIFSQKNIKNSRWFKSVTKNIMYLKNGEDSKDLSSIIESINFLTMIDADRQALLIAFGGGSVTDHVGFVASIYKRGIKYINVPTTLIGMVDASIGGKTAANINLIKNQIGTFYQPEKIFINFNILDEIPMHLINDGIGEIYKYAILIGPELLKKLNKYLDFRNKNDLIRIVRICYNYKYEVVKDDIRDNGIRKILNLGHTFGHAIESESQNKVKHGEAVINGILMSSYFSFQEGIIKQKVFKSIEETGLRLVKKRYKIKNIEDYTKFMLNDKKNKSDKIGIVMIKNIGNVKLKFYSINNIKIFLENYYEYINH